MNVTPTLVEHEREWILARADRTVSLINDVRDDLGAVYGTDVSHVTRTRYTEEVDVVFDDGDLAVNVATLVALLRNLEVYEDYPGFVVDELLGRELAGMLAGDARSASLGSRRSTTRIGTSGTELQDSTTWTPPSRQAFRRDSRAGSGPSGRVPFDPTDRGAVLGFVWCHPVVRGVGQPSRRARESARRLRSVTRLPATTKTSGKTKASDHSTALAYR